ncbi:MAG: sigma-E factor regulatory protein RseB domain-containing protein, partial [Gammaproteobacteria bacterium]
SLLLALWFGGNGGVRAAALDAGVVNWLERMDQAVRTLDYEGRFVYQFGDHLEALLLRHQVHGGSERERLVALNGALREVRRDEDKAICRSEERRELLVERGTGGRSFSPLLPIRLDQLSGNYRFELNGESRVAGRPAQELWIHPLDDLRYGYRLSLDREHALPLRTVVVGVDERPVSQIMFTELQVGIPSAGEPPAGEPPAAAAITEGAAPELDREAWMRPPRWAFRDTPSGFVLNVHRRQRMEPDAEGHQVTAVGEVPALTVRLFGEAVTPLEGATP